MMWGGTPNMEEDYLESSVALLEVLSSLTCVALQIGYVFF
jgi:hypothetical protein